MFNRTVRFNFKLLTSTCTLYILTFILTMMSIESHAHRKAYYFVHDPSFDDVFITENELAYFKTKSELTCSIACLKNEHCTSFSYHALSLYCQHFNVAFWAISVTGTNQIGWLHYDPPKASGCEELFERNYSTGVYYIYPNVAAGVRVKCEMDVNGGGWKVIQHRNDGSVDFKRMWNEYKTGFGNLDGEFWFGNDQLHTITSSANYELRVDMRDWEGNSWYAVYKTFKVGDENSKYKLTVRNYNGTAGDSLTYHNGLPFSTLDREYDRCNVNCSSIFGGAGWWFKCCRYANLNGFYTQGSAPNGTIWYTANELYSMKFSRMMIRRNLNA